VIAAAVVCLAVSAAVAGAAWGGLSAFLRSIDGDDLPPFMDFTGHYYPMAAALLSGGAPVRGFYYPASFALMLVPLTWLPMRSAFLVWFALEIASSLAVMVLGGLLLWPRGRAYALGAVALTAASLPLWHGFRWGQVSALVTALMFAALLARRARPWLAPSLLAVATAIKGFPALLALRWLGRLETGSLARFAGAAALLVVLAPAVALGPAGLMRFTLETRAGAQQAVESWVPNDVNSQYLPFVVARWSDSRETRPGPSDPPAPEIPGLRLLCWLAFFANLAAAYGVARRRDDDALLEAALLFTALPLVLPTSWPHYFVFLPVCQMTALAYARREPRAALQIAGVTLALASMLLASLPAFAAVGGHPRYARLGLLCVANLTLLLALQILTEGKRRAAAGK
jgi:hypothetical protein